MKTKITKFGPYILPGLIFLMLLVLNICYQTHWLDSDMAAEMMFSKLLAEEHHIFATPDWYYSTEFRFLYTQLVMAPLFLIMDNWHLIRMITNIVFYAGMLMSYFYFMKPFKVSRSLTALSASLLLLPFSETMMTHMQMGNTYMAHVIICLVFFGLFLRLTGDSENRNRHRWLLCLCYIVLAVICGVSGVRYLLALQCPLVIASFFYFLRADAFQTFRREASTAEIFSLKAWNRVKNCPEARYFGYSLLGAVAGIAGYGINVLWVSRHYVFQTYDATNFISIYQGVFFERLQNAIGSLLMLFGYIPDKGFLSLRGVISIISFILLAVLVYCTLKSCRKDRGKRLFMAVFVVSAFLLNVFVFVFTTSTMVPRYYITVFIFVLPLVVFYLEGKNPALDKAALTILLTVCLALGTGKTVLSFITTDKNASKSRVAEFLTDNDYDFGFATYTNGNIVTELTNGQVEIANIGDPQYLEFFKWSTPKKYYEEGYHEGETFLLLTAEEFAEFDRSNAVLQGDRVYDDGVYVVLAYESVEKLLNLAEVR